MDGGTPPTGTAQEGKARVRTGSTITRAKYFAKLDYGMPPQPIALFRVNGHLGEYFDKREQAWVADAYIPMRVTEDMDLIELTPEQAANLEARFRASVPPMGSEER